MPNTKTLTPEERKKAKKAAHKKNKELFAGLSKQDRKKYLSQIRDRRAKVKLGIVVFFKKAEDEKKKAAAQG